MTESAPTATATQERFPVHFEFRGTLSADDRKRHIPHSFRLPEDCARLHIEFRYSPARVANIRNMLTLTLFDPNGFRGAGHRHGHRHVVELTPATATPGYRVGALPAGDWTVQIDTHMILPGQACEYLLNVEAISAADHVAQPRAAAASRPCFDTVSKAAPGWYRGDLHAHSVHSDAGWGMHDLLAAARRLGLDFVTLTDHNTTAPLAEFAALATAELLTLGGMELTTFWGHAVCLGATDWIDWRVDPFGVDMNRIAVEQASAGNLFIIAHPQDEGDPKCTGCRWVYPQMQPGAARFVEVWNGRWDSVDPQHKNEGSLALWYSWLNRGLHLLATAGTDAHGPAHTVDGVGFNVVYADELSQPGILAGLRRGRSYLSAGPELRFTAHAGESALAAIGEVLLADRPEIELRAGWAQAPGGAQLRLIRNGEVVGSTPAGAAGNASWRVDTRSGDWFVLEMRRHDGWMVGLTNPIFVRD